MVAFPAHPDDEVLHLGGRLARAAAHGHRTVIVVATDGLMDAVPKGRTKASGPCRPPLPAHRTRPGLPGLQGAGPASVPCLRGAARP
ncbi:PIG-L family deacetylase [Streptomyces sp. NBC_00400]|uniref:PIG-L family deacetylase n=1 Tax=Streptomyces sp. NBC_00400 TaxID=2975737 RepID=UPI002E1BAAD1